MGWKFTDNHKDYDYYIGKIIDDIEFVVDSTKGLTFEEFESDILLNNAICFRFIIIVRRIPHLL